MTKLKRLPLSLCAMLLVLALCACLTACSTTAAPAQTPSEETPAPAAETPAPTAEATPVPEASQAPAEEVVIAGVTVKRFTDRDSGLYPDTFYNSTMLNTGNRGCNACHENLFDVWKLLDREKIVTSVGNTGKKGRITDCLACHQIHSDRTGVYLADVIHASHYSSSMFVDDLKGNCWSCHAMNSLGKSGNGTLNDKGDFQWLLWEDIMYTGALGGYVDNETNAGARAFNTLRGFGEAGYVTSVSVDDGSSFEITVDQKITPEEEVFIVDNFGVQNIDASSWTLDITGGVNNPRSFTLEDLRAMPQTESVANMVCGTNGVGTPFYGNIPVSGVLLADVIEACGGLCEGTNMLYMTSVDTWVMPFCVEDLVANGTLIALDMWGHELTADQGYPATVVNPGMQGASWTKWIKNIHFSADEMAFNPFKMDATNDQKQQLMLVNSCWLANDGAEYKLGETVEINGWSWAAAGVVGETSKIEFSADFGVTWIPVELPVYDFDQYQIVNWNFKWTPAKAGTYVLKVRAESIEGATMQTADSVIVTIVE